LINIFRSTSFIISGNLNRYNDFINFLDDYNIDYVINDNIHKYELNLIDMSYYVNNKSMDVNNKCKFFFDYSLRLIEILSDLDYPNRDLIFNNLICHNFMYCKKLNATFMPMYMYNNINITDNKKYKYGIFISSHTDANYTSVLSILKDLKINSDDVLFMDREDYLDSKTYNTTKDNSYFMGSIDTFLEIANDYTGRHVFSRSYLEVINNNINFNVISFNNSKPISLLGFSHIKYDLISKHKDYNYYNIKYDNKYFKIQNYSNYIKEVLNNYNYNIMLDSIESYHNDRFIIN